jgi:hypothetical protein
MANLEAKHPSQFREQTSAQKETGHERYTELCSLATTGSLTDSEWKLLKAHVLKCADCTRAMQEFREIARTAIPLLVPERSPEEHKSQEVWSPEKARQDLLARVAKGHESGWQDATTDGEQTATRETLRYHSQTPFARTFLAVAAALLLVAGLAGSVYRFGWKKGQEVSLASISDASPLQKQVSALQQEKKSLDANLQVKDVEIETLSKEAQRASAELASLQSLEKQSGADLNRQASALTETLTQRNAVTAERDAIARKLQEAESAAATLKVSLDRLRQERDADLLHTASLEMRIQDLTSHQKQHEESSVSDAQLLASDRDIRELMGARELYIADVFDVDPDSHTQKPYGRVFYTHGKSLIFYAFDLDRQRGVRKVSTYQAWGRRGPHDDRPLNMGIFYLDSDANRRWVLKFDNPEELARIQSVFVTVEPEGGSQEPRGKPLLMASLKSQPNHP